MVYSRADILKRWEDFLSSKTCFSNLSAIEACIRMERGCGTKIRGGEC